MTKKEGPPPGFWTDDKLDELSTRGDPDADDLVLAYFDDTGLRVEDLLGSMVRNLHLPPDEHTPKIAKYLADRPLLPYWVDHDAVARCQGMFGRVGPALGLAMLVNSFPASYASSRGTRILTYTGRLSDAPKRRMMETTQLVWNSMQPGGLDPGEPGWIDARRVRLMHATVRQVLLADSTVTHPVDGQPVWLNEWGVPINQMELAAFLMPMTLTVFKSLDQVGLKLSRTEREDMLHTWCVIGHIIGVDDDLLPMSLESAEEFWRKVQGREYRQSAAGVELMAAHNELLAELLPRFMRGVPTALQRMTLDDETCTILEIGRPGPSRHVFPVMRVVNRGMWRIERNSKTVAWVTDKAGRIGINGFLTLERGGERPTFSISDQIIASRNAMRSHRRRQAAASWQATQARTAQIQLAARAAVKRRALASRSGVQQGASTAAASVKRGAAATRTIVLQRRGPEK